MTSTFEKNLSDVRAFIATGGDASLWFAKAFASWYWVTDFWQINLNGYEYLDRHNKELFFKMLNLRELNGCTDSALYEVALFAIKEWGLLPSENRG